MSILSRVPGPLKSAAIAILPDPWVDAMRRAVMRPYHVEYVVARESRFARFVKRHVLRLYYPPSMVSHQSAFARWVSTDVLGRKPRLFHFEIHVTDHCNLNCKGCGHFSNLAKPSFIEADAFEADVSAMSSIFDLEQVYVMGGEALLHPDIANLIRIARSHLPATRLCLMTNGILVTRMDEEFWMALAETKTELLCASYPITLPTTEIDALAEKYGVALTWTEARTEFFRIPIDLEGGQDKVDSYRRCDGVGNCPIVRNGRLYPCAYAAYADVLAAKFDLKNLEVTDEDYLDITNPPSGSAAMRFMRRPIPWCEHCDFDKFDVYEWGRSERRLDEWVC